MVDAQGPLAERVGAAAEDTEGPVVLLPDGDLLARLVARDRAAAVLGEAVLELAGLQVHGRVDVPHSHVGELRSLQLPAECIEPVPGERELEVRGWTEALR